jgi:hypothetical protein
MVYANEAEMEAVVGRLVDNVLLTSKKQSWMLLPRTFSKSAGSLTLLWLNNHCRKKLNTKIQKIKNGCLWQPFFFIKSATSSGRKS